ncbi:hypothetical protein BA190_09185 [Labrys sp. WJW]|uniref:tyrosine-type recombinase/integrase n=1 Tax=Labrys sp. WJW TaxID=1737983 RepID=UPI00082C6026|nr:tyrosine-type recombinase/integrase [Labrys sp. WJW]OCC05078.1 hypothetical protein BA190_09185 [Labrys sp. WJW]
MGREVPDALITTRNLRSKLAVRAEPYWRELEPDIHIGYRSRAKGGRWQYRWRIEGVYRKGTLPGATDDESPANGLDVLDYSQAVAKVKETIADLRAKAVIEASGPVQTVRTAVDAYIAAREKKEAAQRPGKPLKRDARSRLTGHVLSVESISDKSLHELTEDDLSKWLDGLDGLVVTSVKRLVNDFKAALNAAAGTKGAPPGLPAIIKKGLKVTGGGSAGDRDIQVLPDAEIRAIIAAAKTVDDRDGWEGDWYRLVLLLSATGARFGQTSRHVVGDVQRHNNRIMVPVSFKGTGEKKVSRFAVPIGQDVVDALRPAIAGRKSTDPLLERWRYRQESPIVWVKDRRGPWQNATEMSRLWRKTLEVAELPVDIIPYALRHSSIVRGLRAMLPVRLVAALHDTSTEMIEKHYSAYIIDAMDEVAARAVIPLGAVSDPPAKLVKSTG